MLAKNSGRKGTLRINLRTHTCKDESLSMLIQWRAEESDKLHRLYFQYANKLMFYPHYFSIVLFWAFHKVCTGEKWALMHKDWCILTFVIKKKSKENSEVELTR